MTAYYVFVNYIRRRDVSAIYRLRRFGLPRIAVLGYKVAGIARQQYVIYLTLSAFW